MSSEDERESTQEQKLENKRRRRIHRRRSSQRDGSIANNKSPKMDISHKKKHTGRKLSRESPRNVRDNHPFAEILEQIKEDVVISKEQFVSTIRTEMETSPNATDSTTDYNHRMYVQTPRGFKSVSATEGLDAYTTSSNSNNSDTRTNFKSVAISIQSCWITCSTLCHGFLGGISVAHLLLILTTLPQDWPLECLKKYAVFAELFGNIFYFLAIICMVSCLDRMDLACFKFSQRHSLVWLFILVLYSTTIILSLCCDAMDKRLFFYGGFNITVNQDELRLNKLFNSWNNLSVGRSVGAILGWISVGVVPNDHNLLEYLK